MVAEKNKFCLFKGIFRIRSLISSMKPKSKHMIGFHQVPTFSNVRHRSFLDSIDQTFCPGVAIKMDAPDCNCLI